MDTLKETELPEGWVVVQSLATADATTFETVSYTHLDVYKRQLIR